MIYLKPVFTISKAILNLNTNLYIYLHLALILIDGNFYHRTRETEWNSQKTT